MKNVLKHIAAFAFFAYALGIVFLNMSLAGALLVVIPCLTVAYFIVKRREEARKAALLPPMTPGAIHREAATQDA